MDKEKEEKMKKAAEEACEQIRKEASKRVTDAIVDKVKTMNLDEDISLYDVLMLLDKKFIDNCTVDVTVKGKLRSGLSKTVTKKDLPVKKLLKYAENKK